MLASRDRSRARPLPRSSSICASACRPHPRNFVSPVGCAHARGAVEIGKTHELPENFIDDRMVTFAALRRLLRTDPLGWRARLGHLAYENQPRDLDSTLDDNEDPEQPL